MQVEFKPIDLPLTKDLCIKYRADSFTVSFGNADKFYEADGKGAERYLEWIKAKMAKDPLLAVHCWLDGNIVGQIELGYLNTDASCGYVNLYYLAPDKRHQGLGKFLDAYVVQYFTAKKIKRVRLSVSPTNLPAIRFYEKNGWVNLGPRQDHPEINNMEKNI